MQCYLERLVEFWYSTSDNVIIDEMLIHLNRNQLEQLNRFHMNNSIVVNRHDDYFCGCRANHFSVEFGDSELQKGPMVLITANHKGDRFIILFEVPTDIPIAQTVFAPRQFSYK